MCFTLNNLTDDFFFFLSFALFLGANSLSKQRMLGIDGQPNYPFNIKLLQGEWKRRQSSQAKKDDLWTKTSRSSRKALSSQEA